MQYFEEVKDMKNRPAVQRKAEYLHNRLVDPLFILFLFVLHPILDLLADIHDQLQKAAHILQNSSLQNYPFGASAQEKKLVIAIY